MRKRFKRFFPDLIPVDFSTIHSFAFEVVRDYFQKKGMPYEIIEGNQMDEAEFDPQSNRATLQKGVILRKLFKEANDENITEDQFEAIVTYISFIKNKMIPMVKWQGVACIAPNAAQILEKYERFKEFGHSKRLLDYDDMLTIAVPYNPNAIRDKADLAVGQNIKHRVFGRGSIVLLDDERIHIKFGANEKVLMINKCLGMGLLEPV